MGSSRIAYVKTRVPGYYGLAGIRDEYSKLVVRGEAIARGNKVFADGCMLECDKAISCHLITKQEYQEATGDYDFDDVEFLSEQSNEAYSDSGVFGCDLDKAVSSGSYLFGNDKIGYFFIRINGETIFYARKKVY